MNPPQCPHIELRWFLLIGEATGCIADHSIEGGLFGLLGHMLIGAKGAFIGWLLGLLSVCTPRGCLLLCSPQGWRAGVALGGVHVQKTKV